MKRVIYYALLMIIIVIVLPLLIVRGCGHLEDKAVPEKQTSEGIKINVYINAEKTVREMYLEEYVKGVVAAEMPADFNLEALKAQAVAARTYAYSRLKKIYLPRDDTHNGADICTDPSHCQAWVSKEDAMKKWGIFTAQRNWKKIETAVAETEGVIIMYNNNIINPVFHASSGGRTENAEDVWEGTAVPYLINVPSAGDEACPNYETEVLIKTDDFIKILEDKYTDIKLDKKDVIKDISIEDYTEGDRVSTVKIGNISLKGTEFRSLFSLRSANFSIVSADKNTLKITTIGYGHGVGMSQWGANYLAKSGMSYDGILKYYYTGVNLDTVK